MKVSYYIAPWALPREEVPIHLVWEKQIDFDFIRIDLPAGIQVKEFYNVHIFKDHDNSVIIKKLKTSGFFGFVIALEELFDSLHLAKDITLAFVKSDRNLYSKTLRANFYRPKLELIDSPKSITLIDNADLKQILKMTLKLVGFGRINITTDINIGGGFHTRGEALYRELVGRLLSAFKNLEFDDTEERGISIDPNWLEKEAKKYVRKLKHGEVPDEFSEHDLEEFREWINNPENSEAVLEALSRQMENILIDSLLFYFDRFPTDGVEFRQGTPAMCIESATENVQIRFRYSDSLQNEYEPIQMAVRIFDQRTSNRDETEIPINIRWIKETMRPIKEGV
jgi:hypothetical protein